MVEERVAGDSLFEVLVRAEPGQAPHYLELAAQWLSKLHNARLRITPAQEYLQIEPDRLQYYLKSLIETHNRFLDRVREIKDFVLQTEIELIRSRPEILVQGHGDYHPRNIFLGRDEADGSEYVTAIDFGSSYQLPRAFDVGTFLAQVDLYKARTCLSILYYFAKRGLGGTENFWRILVEAERSLAAVAAGAKIR